MHPALFLFLKIDLVICGPLWLHMNFEIKSFFSISEKMPLECNENKKPQISPHTCQDGYYEKKQRQHVLARMWRNCKPGTLFVGIQNDVDAMENRLFKTKNIIWSNNNIFWYLSKINEIRISSDISTCTFISALFAMEKLNFHQ